MAVSTAKKARTKVDKEENPHYVNNVEFSHAIFDYVGYSRSQTAAGAEKPVVPDYIAECFLKIGEGLSHRGNFVRYTYREEMVMDAVENCLKAIENYNLEAATRSGKPNAFGYFTQIAWYAFLRRIEKEKRQQDIKLKYMSETGIENIVMGEINSDEASRQTQAFVDSLRHRIDLVKDADRMFKEYSDKQPRRKRTRRVDSDLTEFFTD